MENELGFFKRTGIALGFVTPVTKQEKRAVDGMAAGVMPPARPVYTDVTAETALTLGAVQRSISIITASVAQMDLGVYRDGIEIKSPAIIRNPNFDDSVTRFVEETVFSLAAHGNAFWRLWGEYPNFANVVVLDPNSVTVTRDEKTGKKVYWVGTERVESKYIRHLKLNSRPGYDKGFGPIQANADELRAALLLRDYQTRWYSKGVPEGMLTTDLQLGPDEAQELMDAFKRFLSNNDNMMVGHTGIRYEHFNIKPSEAQFLEVQQASVVSIARMFGIPAMHLLAELTGTSNTYLNLEQANIVFLQTTLVKYMNEIEEAFSSLLPRGQRVQFKEDGLLRMDSVTKWSVIKTQTEIGYTSGDELRKQEGKAPLPRQEVKPNSNQGSEQNGND